MEKLPPLIAIRVAGIGIGLVLLTAYVVVGQGLGASGAFASVVASVLPSCRARRERRPRPAVAPYCRTASRARCAIGWCSSSPASCWAALRPRGSRGRLRRATEHGAGVSAGQRMYAAVGGGVLMGVGAKLARGCTSGQALSGGALLSVGSWIFIACCFAAGYGLSPLARRLWR